ncbi:V-type ATP synthase subunit I [Truepera radiovictrix]|nr:V-type ATPase 116kDa subunit family protein [Truepera radiovictrix]WMT56310.1 V-type ATPase 116kDa subunit family protein [Truepera radiovictrix]
MIAPMEQLLVVGRKGIVKDLLVSLQTLGVVHIVRAHGDALPRFELKESDRRAQEAWDGVVAKTEALLELLSAAEGPVAGKDRVPLSLSELRAYLNDLSNQVDSLVAERAEIDDELDLINTYLPPFRELAPTLAQLEGSRYLRGAAFLVPSEDFLSRVRAALKETFDNRFALATRRYGKGFLAVVAVLKGELSELQALLSRLGLAELQLPERFKDLGVAKAVHVMQERAQTLPKRRKTLQDDLAHLGKVHGGRLRLVRDVALNHRARYEVMSELAGGRYGFALQGWVPAKDRRQVVAALERQFGGDLVIEVRKADEHHDEDVPVKLENPGWVKPFEGLLSLFAPPKYGYFDPSWTLALFFPLFFGFIVGDIGFGLLFLALGVWFRLRGARGNNLNLGPLGIVIPSTALRPIGTVINWCAAWTMVWGFLYGEFFGNFLEHFPPNNPIFYPTYSDHYHGVIPIAIFRVHESGFYTVLLLALVFGTLQVLFGWALRAYYGLRHGDMKHFWEGVGMFAGIAAIVTFAYGFLTNNLSDNAFVLFFVALGFAIFFAGLIFSRLPLMLVELISNSGNILSYLRLFAVGLSAALIATLATDLGYALGGTLPIVGPALGILVAFAVHLIALTLKAISYTLQPLRLHYVEFFTKFGFYEETGRPYRPFRILGGKA